MPKAVVLYHFLHPDDVVSSLHLTHLCEDLVSAGWEVEGWPCQHACRSKGRVYPPEGEHNGVKYRRVYRPKWPQERSWGRILNSIWMAGAWSVLGLIRRHDADVLIIGTDPVFSVATAVPWKLFRPSTKIAHWCFDLYPDAAVANGLLRRGSIGLRLLQALSRRAYAACDLVVDIGACMKQRLLDAGTRFEPVTIPPWALEEPGSPLEVDERERRSIFGGAALCMLYSGNFGRAHSYDLLLGLASQLAPEGGTLAFSVRGNRAGELQAAAAEQRGNVVFTEFASEERLAARLSCADVHVMSLEDEWTGTVVPSKFFGALAAGRPVVFAGSRDSAVSGWIDEFGVGWVLTPDNIAEVAHDLADFSRTPARKTAMFEHCHQVYTTNFRRARATSQWDSLLRLLLGEGRNIERAEEVQAGKDCRRWVQADGFQHE